MCHKHLSDIRAGWFGESDASPKYEEMFWCRTTNVMMAAYRCVMHIGIAILVVFVVDIRGFFVDGYDLQSVCFIFYSLVVNWSAYGWVQKAMCKNVSVQNLQ